MKSRIGKTLRTRGGEEFLTCEEVITFLLDYLSRELVARGRGATSSAHLVPLPVLRRLPRDLRADGGRSAREALRRELEADPPQLGGELVRAILRARSWRARRRSMSGRHAFERRSDDPARCRRGCGGARGARRAHVRRGLRGAQPARRTWRSTFAASYGESIQRGEILDAGPRDVRRRGRRRAPAPTLQLALGRAAAGRLRRAADRDPALLCRRPVARTRPRAAAHGRRRSTSPPSAGADVVWLGVWEENPRGIAFYRKCGFAVVGSHIFVVGTDPQRDVLMARPCAPEAAV